MALQQAKLTRGEWEGIENPINEKEKGILKMLIEGYDNIDAFHCEQISMLSYTKMEDNAETHDFMYYTYFKKQTEELLKFYNVDVSLWPNSDSKKKLKKADMFRIQNTNCNLEVKLAMILEYIILDILDEAKRSTVASVNWNKAVYAARKIMSYKLHNFNCHVRNAVNLIYQKQKEVMNMSTLYNEASEVLLQNPHLKKVHVYHLYQHQKELYSHSKRTQSKLIFLRAPTGTGKTVSPLGLLKSKRVIFVCAARHVGLSLARSAISMRRKVAFAFNCASADDVRLHYFAAKECIRDKRSGAIRKVDNSVGDNVEMIISDLKSCKIAMYYMAAFNDVSNLILYWDEPTISLDRKDSLMHKTISEIWGNLKIPNIVLSSATLPFQNQIQSVCQDYKARFGGEIVDITSSDYEKSISVINVEQREINPHRCFDNFKDFARSREWCITNPTILRYISIQECVDFGKWMEKNILEDSPLEISSYFDDCLGFTISSLKMHYLHLLKVIEHEDFNDVKHHFYNKGKKMFDSSVLLTTSDAHTLTNGPTIYLAQDVSKIARFLLQKSNVPNVAVEDVYKDLDYNRKISKEIEKLEKQASPADEGSATKKSDKKAERETSKIDQNETRIQRQIQQLLSSMRIARLHDMFVPNTTEHLSHWCPRMEKSRDIPYSSNISEDETRDIMNLRDTQDIWKLLLLMGIGVLENSMSVEYTEKMKTLASSQKLYLLIAGDDYIYGTNYQFGHVYIGKDLVDMTQDKIIQAVGRVGRDISAKQYTVRVRHNDIGQRLFSKVDDKIEVINMRRLFNEDAILGEE
jgi:hypothetical protein